MVTKSRSAVVGAVLSSGRGLMGSVCLPGMSSPWHVGHMWPKIAADAVQHKIVKAYRHMASCMPSHSDPMSDSLKPTLSFGGALSSHSRVESLGDRVPGGGAHCLLDN